MLNSFILNLGTCNGVEANNTFYVREDNLLIGKTIKGIVVTRENPLIENSDYISAIVIDVSDIIKDVAGPSGAALDILDTSVSKLDDGSIRIRFTNE